MVPERIQDGNFENRKIHVWTTAHMQENTYGFYYMLDFNEAMDELAIACSLHCVGHVLRREDCDFLRILELVCEVQWRNERPK